MAVDDADSERVDSRCSELDRKRKAVKSAADLGHRRCFGVCELEELKPVSRTIHKELNCRKRESFIRVQV